MPELPSWLLVIPVMGFLILIHEMGHFFTAKLLGISVTEFGFGFPPRIFGIRYRNTIYSINWLLPLGGFVRFIGSDDPDNPNNFDRQKVYKRILILTAGSLTNLMVAILIITFLLMQPHDVLLGGDIIISSVAPGSPAEKSGLNNGDYILSIDSNPINKIDDLVSSIQNKLGQPVELNIRRGTSRINIGYSPETALFETIQVVPRKNPPKLLVVQQATNPDSEVSLSDAQLYDSSLEIGDTMKQGAVGITIGLANAKFEEKSDPIWLALPNSLKTISGFLSLQWNGITQGVSTRSNPGFTGPIGIAQVTGEVVERFGISSIFQLMAFLSLILGVVNLLPIPALDGGRLLFVLIEWVGRGRRISAQREGLIHFMGFVVLIAFIIVISYSDILRILDGESILR